MDIEQLAGYCVHCLKKGKRKYAFTVYSGNSSCYDHFENEFDKETKALKRS